MSVTFLDYLDLWLLRAAKFGRRKHDADSGAFYDSFFTDDDIAKYRGDVRNAWRYGRLHAVYDELYADRPADVCDVGCGLGIALLWLPETAHYLGVEYAEATLATARRLHAGRRDDAVFRAGGFPELPVETASQDFVICTEVVEHIADDAQAMRELRRILRPGGHMLFTVPSTHYWPDYERLIGHFRHYSGPGLAGALESAGFAVVRQLPQHNAFWRRYHYRYVVLRALEVLLQKTVAPRFVLYETGFYKRMAARILSRLAENDTANDPASTFVLVRAA